MNSAVISGVFSNTDERYLKAIEEINPKIKAIVVEIDSPGVSPVAGEEIAEVLSLIDEKPVISLIKSQGTSAAYYAAVGADKIFASKHSDIGSIGVTASYLDYSEKNKKEGLTYN